MFRQDSRYPLSHRPYTGATTNICKSAITNWIFVAEHGKMERMGRKHVLLQLGYTSKRRLEGIAAFAKAHDWSIAIEDRSSLPSGWTGDGALVLLRQRQPRVAAFAQRLAARGIPVVDLSICHPEINLPRVVGDHETIGKLAAEACHLPAHTRERPKWKLPVPTPLRRSGAIA